MDDKKSKMETLGFLSAGIAHEIQNPLNFVINFSKMSERLLTELQDIVETVKDQIDEDDAADLEDITADLVTNMQKIKEHGERATSIIQGILLISRGKEGERLPTDIPKLVHEYLWLSYHAKRANDKSFNITINEDYQENMPMLMVIPQDLSRAIVNVMNNACYAVQKRQQMESEAGNEHLPFIAVKASYENGMLTITISDNGTGIAEEVKDKLFHETITTKPVGEGTGLGMQITYDIIKKHGGEISFDSEEGKGTTFRFDIPCEKA